MDKKIEIIKQWLGTGSINIFGLPFSGKDTVGIRLAETLGAKFLSSGLILRAAAEADNELRKEMASGALANTNKFHDIVLPYLGRPELSNYPLILSSVGRWEGEEYDTIDYAKRGGHEIKVTILLNISQTEAHNRWQISLQDPTRGNREDDKSGEATFNSRIAEFNEKTMPVITTYQKRGILISVNANASRDAVFESTIDAIYQFAKAERDKREIPFYY